MPRVTKGAPLDSGARVHKSKGLPDDLVRFSFKYFYDTAKFGCHAVPEGMREPYWVAFMERLKAISSMTINEFRGGRGRALKIHTHKWDHTSEPDGFTQLNAQLRDYEPWQFCIDRSNYGRVHGFILDEIFYVIWIDPQHQLYPVE